MSRQKKDKKPLSPAEVIAKRRSALGLRIGYMSLCWRIVFIVVVCWLIFTQVFLLTQVRGNGMFPAVKDGDLAVAYRLQREYVKDDVVFYTVEGQRHVGRVIARETDVVMLDDSGTLLVNGSVQTGEILYPSYAKEGLSYPYTVPEGQVFIMGDYRTQSEDSRDYNSIPLENVEAKVLTILRRQGI